MNEKKYRVDEKQFLKIETPEIAYVLGLLWADGYITKYGPQINILEKDMDFLLNIFLKIGDWCIYSFQPSGKRQRQKLLRTSNKIIADFLIENDYLVKSGVSACKILSNIPENLKHYWFRGLVDGDGCFFFNKKRRDKGMSIGSRFDQDWEYMETISKKIGVNFRIERRKKMCKGKEQKDSIFLFHTFFDIENFGNFIYQGYEQDKIGLPRKYEKFVELVAYSKEFQNSKAWKYIGVGFDKQTNKFYAKHKRNKIQKRLGSFETLEEAARCYDAKIIEIYGENARTNKKLFGLI